MLADIPLASSLFFQILLTINVYVSVLWGCSYGFFIIVNLFTLKSMKGIFIIVSYVSACLGEGFRLYAGYSANLKSNTRDLNTFYVLSPFIQLPNLVFLFLFFIIPNLLLTIITIVLFGLIVLEMIVGLFACHKLTRNQSEIFRIRLSEHSKKSDKTV